LDFDLSAQYAIANAPYFVLVPKLEFGNEKNGVANWVLACTDCNRGVNGKFAHLPALPLLQRLHESNEYLNDFEIAIHDRKIIIGLIPLHNCPTALLLVPKLQLGNQKIFFMCL